MASAIATKKNRFDLRRAVGRAIGLARQGASRATVASRGATAGATRAIGWLGAAAAWVERLFGRIRMGSLMRRIIALNALALAVLVLGILYLTQYRAGLIEQRIASLTTTADVISVAIAEQAGDPLRRTYNRFVANEVLRRLSLPTGLRAQLYDRNGRLTADTRSFFGGGAAVEVQDLGSVPSDGALRRIEELFDRFATLFHRDLPLYQETPPAGVSHDQEVYAALQGDAGSAKRANSEDELILSVAVPVKHVRTVMGALVLSTEGGDIDEIVAEERMAILSVFIVAIAVSALLSGILASTIARPLHRLAQAADEGVTQEQGGVTPGPIEIPDLTHRSDEIGHLSGALRRMTGALYDRMGAIEAFAADVAHELKNPLTSMRSAVETMGIARTDEQRARLLELIQHDISRMNRLVTDISNASRLDAELGREAKQAFDLGALIETVSDIGAAAAESRSARIAVKKPLKTLRIRGLEGRLAQVLHNLVDNALSFSPEGGTVTLSARARPVRGQPGVRIEVVDEGPGVPPDNIESIFQRFYSERPESESFGNHSGLGLSICRQIVEAHGGRIWAENREERPGARFIVELPR